MKNIIKILMTLSIVVITGVYANAQVSVGISIRTAPPPLPVYDQPFCPGDGYIWVPGYWAYSNDGYYWVPGAWVLPPQYGLYWTPGYWGFNGGYYGWHRGYWGHHVGFYGGINYGFGYSGAGYAGGIWSGNTFRYNTAVTHVNPAVVHNTYINKTVINNTTVVNNRTSFNGQGGVMAKPTPQEQQASAEPHVQPTREQLAHETSARSDKNQFASANHGQPAKLAVSQVGTNESGNPQNHIAQNNTKTVKPNLSQNEQAQNTDLHNANKVHLKAQDQSIHHDVNSQVHPDVQTQQTQPEVNNAQNGSDHENADNAKKETEPKPVEATSHQTHMNGQTHHFHSHGGNSHKSSGEKSQKK